MPLKWNTASLVLAESGPNGGTATNCSSAEILGAAEVLVVACIKIFKRKNAEGNAGMGIRNSTVPPEGGMFSVAAGCHSSVNVGRISNKPLATPAGNVATKSRLVPTTEMELMVGASAEIAADARELKNNIPKHKNRLHNELCACFLVFMEYLTATTLKCSQEFMQLQGSRKSLMNHAGCEQGRIFNLGYIAKTSNFHLFSRWFGLSFAGCLNF